MTTDLLQTGWTDFDSAELRFILLECIGKPGQYDGCDGNPNTFYLPLAGHSCRIKLTFSDSKQIVAIEPGAAFDATQWEQVVEEVERTGPHKVGRDCSFSSYRVGGSWRGKRSGVQLLPPPADAPVAPVEMAEHPFRRWRAPYGAEARRTHLWTSEAQSTFSKHSDLADDE